MSQKQQQESVQHTARPYHHYSPRDNIFRTVCSAPGCTASVKTHRRILCQYHDTQPTMKEKSE